MVILTIAKIANPFISQPFWLYQLLVMARKIGLRAKTIYALICHADLYARPVYERALVLQGLRLWCRHPMRAALTSVYAAH